MPRLNAEDLSRLRLLFDTMLVDLLGIKTGTDEAGADIKPFEGAVDLLMDIRKNAKEQKDWATSDLIRDKARRTRLQCQRHQARSGMES